MPPARPGPRRLALPARGGGRRAATAPKLWCRAARAAGGACGAGGTWPCLFTVPMDLQSRALQARALQDLLHKGTWEGHVHFRF